MTNGLKILVCALLLAGVSCSRQEQPVVADGENWDAIQPMADVPTNVPTVGKKIPALGKTEVAEVPDIGKKEEKVPASGKTIPTIGTSGDSGRAMVLEKSSTEVDYAALAQRLNDLTEHERGTNETFITGENLVFDYERRFVRMDNHVTVTDDRGELRAGALIGRFSESNSVDLVEAEKGVMVTSEDRKAIAMSATYSVQSGEIRMDGGAEVSQGSNLLSGGRIRFWMKGGRRMVCEPNARLLIRDSESLGAGDYLVSGGTKPDAEKAEKPKKPKAEGKTPLGDTEITADRIVFDEEQKYAEFDHNVKVRDPRAALDCEKVRLHLKDGNKIDWIEALSEVIIQVGERRAIADTAKYLVEEGKFVLEGSPKVSEGRHIMTGDKITFWRDEQRMVCEPRARVLIYPDEQMRQQFLKDLKE